MSKKLFAALLLFISLLALSAVALADTMPDFIFKDLNGKEYSRDSLRGTPVVLYVGSHL